MKKLLIILGITILGTSIVYAAPYFRQERSLLPVDSTENLGTTTAPWDELHVNEICLLTDCETTWPTGGGDYPFSTLTNYGVTNSATSTPIWGQAGFNSSSTVHILGAIRIGDADGNILIGDESSSVSGVFSTAVGYNNIAQDTLSSAFGSSNTVTGEDSHAFGESNTVAFNGGFAFGYLNNVDSVVGNSAGYAIGRQNTVNGTASYAFGRANTVSGTQAFAFGDTITNTTNNSVMIGPSNTAKVTILSSGNVGIGTSTPDQLLNIHSPAGQSVAVLSGNSGGKLRVAQGTAVSAGTIDLAVATPKAGLFRSGSTDSFFYYDITNGNTVMNNVFSGASNTFEIAEVEYARLSGATATLGNFGIGTTSPFTKLGVTGTITANNINATSTTASSTFQLAQLGTTTVSNLNGVIVVDGVRYAKTGAGIEKAVNAAPDGSTVYVPSGTYLFNSGDSIEFSGKSISLVGTGATSTIFSAGTVTGGIIYDFFSTDTVPSNRQNISISGITFDLNSVSNVSAIQMSSSLDVTIKNNIFREVNGIWAIRMGSIGGTLGAETDDEIKDSSTANLTFDDNIIEDSDFNTYEGFLCINCSNGRVRGNTFRRISEAAAGMAIYGYSRNMVVTDNSWASSTADAIYFQQSDYIVFANNTIEFPTDSNSLGQPAMRIINSADIIIESNIFKGYTDGSSGSGGIFGYDTGSEFDGHMSRYPDSTRIKIHNNEFSGYYNAINIPQQTQADKRLNQKDITISNNYFDGGQDSAIFIGHASTTGIARIKILNNVSSSTAVANRGVINLIGSTTDTTLLSDITINGNDITPSTAGGNSAGIYVSGASNIRIFGNYTEGTGKSTFSDIELVSTVSTAQTTLNSTGFGIGVDDPLSSLHIESTSGTNSLIKTLSDSANSTAALSFGITTSGSLGSFSTRSGDIKVTRISGNSFDMGIFLSDASTNLQRLTVKGATGNVGIGTTSPFTKLGVAGTITSDNINATSTTATSTFSGDVVMGRILKLKGYTVATLPTCNAALQGGQAFVTDALAPAFLTTLVGGGAVVSPAFCDGTNWIAE